MPDGSVAVGRGSDGPVALISLAVALESYAPAAESSVPGVIDKAALLCQISKCRVKWGQAAENFEVPLSRGIALGHVLALDWLHGWVKKWKPSPPGEST